MPAAGELEPIAPDIWRLEIATPLALHGRIALRTNVYVLETADGLKLIDCGGMNTYTRLRSALARRFQALPLRSVYLTHAHADHAGAAARCRNEGVEVFVADGDVDMLLDGGPWGVPTMFRYPPCRPSGRIDAGSLIPLKSGGVLEAVPMSGHTPGSMAFAERARRLLICGDSIFGPCRPGFLGTFLLQVLTARRQSKAELREQQDSIVRAVGRLTAAGGWLVLPGHGPVTEPGAFADPLGRAMRLLARMRQLARSRPAA